MAKFTPRPGLDELVARMIVGDVNKIIEATAATARRLAPPTKQWISVMDGRERHSHNLAHGKTIPDNLRFTLKAFQWDVEHPHLGGVRGSIRRHGDGMGYDGPTAKYSGSSSYLLKPRDRSGEHWVQVVNCRCVIKRDPLGIARMVGVDLAHAVGTRVSGMVYAEGPGVLAAEHGDEYPLPSGPRRERGTKFMARTVAKMGGL